MERFPGIYRGKVVARSDSKSGRLKIYVPGVYPEKYADDPDSLPDAEQAGPLFGGVSKGYGMFSYPHIGAILWVFFQNGDQNLPVYFASCLGGPEAAGQFGVVEPIPENKTGAYIHKIVCGLSTILISEDGDIVIETRYTAPNGPRDSTIKINKNGAIEINAENSLQITADEIKILAKSKMMIDTPRFRVKTNDPEVAQPKANGILFESDDTVLRTYPLGNVTVETKTNGTRTL